MSWHDLAHESPTLAAYGAERLNDRVAYLATVGENGRPRVYPVTPLLRDDRLLLFMYPTSPKGHDLERGSWYALHCSVEGNDGGAGEFSARGVGHRVMDPAAWELARPGHADEFNTRFVLYELEVRQALSTTYGDGGAETRTRWSRARRRLKGRPSRDGRDPHRPLAVRGAAREDAPGGDAAV